MLTFHPQIVILYDSQKYIMFLQWLLQHEENAVYKSKRNDRLLSSLTLSSIYGFHLLVQFLNLVIHSPFLPHVIVKIALMKTQVPIFSYCHCRTAPGAIASLH